MTARVLLVFCAILSCKTPEQPKPVAREPFQTPPNAPATADKPAAGAAAAQDAGPAPANQVDAGTPGGAQDKPAVPPAAAAAAPPPLFTDLGSWHHQIDTAVPQAQAYFDQGLRLMYGFNHDEAIRAFREAARLDPQCAMCRWGIAISLGPNINLGTDPEREKLAFEELQAARRLVRDEGERAYVLAASQRYGAVRGPDRKALDQAYAEAMRGVLKARPDDADAAVLFAEAMMDLRPWDLWTKDGKPQPGTGEILATLEGVLKAHPDHPGANHFYIHVVEGSPDPARGLAAADRLPALMPGAGHVVHMPSHIYVHTGQYAEASKANERAIEVDRAYLAREKPQGMYAMMYVAHNFQFLWATASMEGRSAVAIAAARELAQTLSPEMVREMKTQMPSMDYFVAPTLFALVRFGRWNDVLREPAPAPDFNYLGAVRHYARGLAFSATGKQTEAQKELAALQAFTAALPRDAMMGPTNSAQAVFAVATKQLAGELAARSGKSAEAVRLLQDAVRAEDALGYDEPPPWYQPVRHSLGAVLLQAGRAKDAAAVYREDLKKNPGNGWALFGLVQSLKKLKDKGAAVAQKDFEKAWARADVKLTASRF